MKKYYRYFLALFIAVLALSTFLLWRFNVSSQHALESGLRQFEQIQLKLERYLAYKRDNSMRPAENGNLFAEINSIAAQCGLSGKLENLRPAGKDEDSLELQLRSLYLGETMRFISMVEDRENIIIERLVMRRGTNNLLDLEARIKRSGNAR